MSTNIEASEGLADSLAEGIAAVMAASAELAAFERVEDLTDLFLDELNRLWCEPDMPEAA